MPKRKTDKSAPVLSFDRDPWKPIAPEAILLVAEKFEIQDRAAFAQTVHEWSCEYGWLRRVFRDVPSRADQRDIYRTLARDLDKAFQTLSSLGPTVKMKLSLSVGNREMDEDVRDAVAMMMRNESITKPGKPFEDSFDVDEFADDVGMLKSISEYLSNSIDRQLKDGAPSLSPDRNLDIEYLIAQIRTYFKAQFPNEPTGRNFDPAGLEGPAGQTPLNRHSEFTVECCRLIEPQISQSQIDSALAQLIHKERSQQ